MKHIYLYLRSFLDIGSAEAVEIYPDGIKPLLDPCLNYQCEHILNRFIVVSRVPTDPGKREKALNLKFCSRPWKSPEFWSWVVKINLWPGKLLLRVLSHKWSSCDWNTSVSLLLIFAKFTNLPSFHRKFWTQRVPVSYQSKQRPGLTDGHLSLFRTCAQSWDAAATKFDKHGNF